MREQELPVKVKAVWRVKAESRGSTPTTPVPQVPCLTAPLAYEVVVLAKQQRQQHR